MKYKIGDRVRLKIENNFHQDAARDVRNLLNRVATIRAISEGDFPVYRLEELRWAWVDDWIDGLYSDDYKMSTSIECRFELMDFD